MPNVTLGSTVSSVLQWLAVMIILSVVLNARTTTGNGLLPPGVQLNLGNVINTENTTYLNQSAGGPVHLNIQQQISSQTANSANYAQLSYLQSLAGLAFIPAYFGQFMSMAFSIPGTIILIVQTLVTQPSSVSAWFTFSAVALSSCMMAYYIIIFGFKVISPVVKTEIEEV